MKTIPTQNSNQQSAAARTHLEELLDKALADTFPASDPVSYLVPEEPEGAAKKKTPPAPKGNRE